MRSQRILLGGILVVAAGVAAAQAQGTLRWRAGASALGLQASHGSAPVPCGALALSCDREAVLPLYGSDAASHSLSMRVGWPERASLRFGPREGASVTLVGRADLLPELGVYGRVGTALARAGALAPIGPQAPLGVNYGVGLSWDFSRRASAVLGFESYDVRGASGEPRDVRATRLGLQWRY